MAGASSFWLGLAASLIIFYSTKREGKKREKMNRLLAEEVKLILSSQGFSFIRKTNNYLSAVPLVNTGNTVQASYCLGVT